MTSSPEAHVSMLPGNRWDGLRFNCGSCDQSFGHLKKRHEHFKRSGHTPTEIEEITVAFYLNLRHQTLRCPVCSFNSRHVKSPRSFIKHFACHSEFYTLNLVHVCTICTEQMSLDEIHGHLLHHQLERIPLTPTNKELNISAASSFYDSPLFHSVIIPTKSPDSSPSSTMPSPEPSTTPNDCPPESDAPDKTPSSLPSTTPTIADQYPELLSPVPLSPPLLSQPLDNSTTPSPSTMPATTSYNLPLTESTFNTSPYQLQTLNLFPTTVTTPPPNIPPFMANIIATPEDHLPPTRQGVLPPPQRPTAADFFDKTPPPTFEDLPAEIDNPTQLPPRPTSLTTSSDPSVPLASPLAEDPSTAVFPTTQTTMTLHEFRERYNAEFNVDMDFEDFQSLTKQFTTDATQIAREISSHQRPRPAPRRPDRPSALPPIDRRNPTSSDPVAAKRLQHLYRVSKKRAARKIFGDDSPGFDGTLDETTAYFTTTFGPRDSDTDNLLQELSSFVPSAATDESLFDTPSPSELSQKLKNMANSAPGKDRLEYRHLRLLDPRCEILAKIFRHCFLARDVPADWKSATTILIHKKDSTNDPSNIRPIALMSCLYKLLMEILAKRMTTFSIDNHLLSPEQMSARPSEGCYEHAFLLESILNDACRQPRPLCLAWLDIKNAFGSIPHSALLLTLKHMGFPTVLIEMIGNIYTGASTEVLIPLGKTPPIPINSGVKQGCPLSAILFNLSLELVIRKCVANAQNHPRGPLKHHGAAISVLAYADDLVLLACYKDNLQSLLDAAFSAADVLDLTFRPDKCASLSMTKHAPRIQDTIYTVHHHPIPALKREEHYRYLGVPIVLIPDILCLETLLDELTDKLRKIEQCLLAPWQKLDAIRTFVQPCLTYGLRSTDPTTKSLQGYRSQLVQTIRSICSLPTRATTHYIFAAKQAGGLGFMDPCLENHLQTIVQALKMLACTDPTVSLVAAR